MGVIMVDRNNLDDLLNVVNDDFNWLIEDITQYNSIIKEKRKDCIDADLIDEEEELKQKYLDIKKLIEKVENLRLEYVSLFKEEAKEKETNDRINNFIELSDWTDTNPEVILLFGKKYSVKFWRDILVVMLEELLKSNPGFIDKIDQLEEFKGRTRLYFTYDDSLIDKKLYKQLSNGLYVMVNSNANSIMSLCKRILKASGNDEDKLKILSLQESKQIIKENVKLETDNNGKIKLPKNYGSISIDTDIFKQIVNSIIDRKAVYNTDYISPRKIVEKFDDIILNKTKYTISYPVIINIINYFIDFRLIDNYPGTKKGKYIVVDDSSLKSWLDKNV